MVSIIHIKAHQWGTICCNVLNRGKTLQDEATRLGIDEATLIKMGDDKFHHSQEWEETKRTSEKRSKQKKQRRKPVSVETAPKTAAIELVSTTAPVVEDDNVTENIDVEMSKLLQQKEEIENKMTGLTSVVEENREIFRIRQEAFASAKAVLEKAQVAVQKAQAELDKSKNALCQAEGEKEEAQRRLKHLEKEITELKEKAIYLVDPWYTGNLPQFGTFISTVEVEGVKVQVQEVPEIYLPEASLEGVLLFDFVPDYKKARVFCGLVAKYEIEGIHYNLLVEDERIKNLLKMYVYSKE